MATTARREHRYQLTVPEDWRVLKGYAGTLVTVAEPEAEASDGFATNVNVVRAPNEQGLALPALLDETIRELRQTLADVVVLDRSDDDARLLFTYRLEELGLTADQRYVLDDDGYFVVTATATNDEFGDASAATDAVVASFTVVEELP